MYQQNYRYCHSCGRSGDAGAAYCPLCGTPRRLTPSGRTAGVAFLLNELQAPPLAATLTADQRERLETHYRGELLDAVEAAAPARVATAASPRTAAPASVAAPASPHRAAAPAYDWGWVAEQQANLFLFAGAFLTVVAALIYVGYSGQAVSGVLKMILLVGYTLAFLAAGTVCLRMPRVAIAGHVFFAVGALLVPMNFVAAHGIFAEEDLDPRTMWLAGSAVTAAFYTSVAWLGLGRVYAFGAGVALASAAAAFVAVAEVPVEWAPACFIVLALVMALPRVLPSSPQIRDRIAEIWALQSQAIALGAIGFAVLLAPFAGEIEGFDATRWYLPLTFAGFGAFATALAVTARRPETAVAAFAGLSGAFVSVVYATGAATEYYAVSFGALAFALGVAIMALDDESIRERVPAGVRDAVRYMAVAATGLAAFVAVAVTLAAQDDAATYEIQSRWYLAAAAVLALGYYLLEAFAARERFGVIGAAVALAAVAASVVYGFDLSAEYYAFALIAPALLIAAAARWAPVAWDDRLAALWRSDIAIASLAAAGGGVAVAALAALVSADPANGYEPQYRAFLPVAIALAGLVAAIEASRGRAIETSLAVCAGIVGTIVTVPYAVGAGPEWYGVSLAAAAFALALGGRTWMPDWLDENVRDGAAVTSITAAWLPFEGVYADVPRFGAGVHLAAAMFYAIAAFADRSPYDLREFLDIRRGDPVRRGVAWLYAAGLTGVIGYVYVLRALPAAEGEGRGALAIPLMIAAVAFVVASVAVRRWRPDFRLHLYVISLLVAAVSLAAPQDAGTLAMMLAVYVAVYAALAIDEDLPLLAAPAAAFALGAIPAWRAHADADFAMIPIGYSLIAVGLSGALAFVRKSQEWTIAIAAGAGVFAVAAPVAGFGILASQTEMGLVDGVPFEETALYQWSTISVAVAALLALGAAWVTGRRWIIIPATAGLTAALLLQIGSYSPENPQAYTLAIGTYLVLLGLLGLWKYRLAPEFSDLAPYAEGIGAAVIMYPSFVQSLAGDWQYQLILLIEAAAFFAGSIALRRRGMLAASLLALVLVAGRALLDAVHALPNWMVVMVAGMALLGIGVGILAGRERWDRWEKALLGWWNDAGNGQPAA